MHNTPNRLAPWLIVLGACGGATSEQNAPTADLPPVAPTALTVAAPVHHIDSVAREPMLVEHPSGALFVSGYGSQVTGVDPKAAPNLWRSDDDGASWNRVDIGTPEDGAIGNSDVDLAVGPDGTLYFVTMGFDRTAMEGTHVAVGVSHDVGANWSWHLLSEDRYDDRPWVGVAPDGTAHVIWNDGSGVSHTVSRDNGATWAEQEKVHPRGGSSHLALGPNGELAVRITPISASANSFDEGLELIAVSTDGGETWSKHPAPSDIEWDPTFSDPNAVPRWVEPLAWDATGDLYHLWSEGQVVKLAQSRDHGASWEEWVVATDDEIAYFPYLVARGPGELAATWFSGGGETMAVQVAMFQVPDSEDSEPQVLLSKPFQPDIWQERADQKIRDPGGEYVPVAFLKDGGLAVATPVQDLHGGRFGFSYWRVEAQ
jgi:hypothetical protein